METKPGNKVRHAEPNNLDKKQDGYVQWGIQILLLGTKFNIYNLQTVFIGY